MEITDAILEFQKSLKETLEHAERISKLGLVPKYQTALKNFRDYGELVELVFDNRNVLMEDMLLFGPKRGGRIGMPVIETWFEGGDLDG